MPRQNYSTMPLEALVKLRNQINSVLAAREKALRKQLATIGGASEIGGHNIGRISSLAGRKVAPKYRGPNGELWAGRGAQPVWMRDAVKKGKKPQDYLIAKPTKNSGQKRRSGRKAVR